jgi:hypothetical protein
MFDKNGNGIKLGFKIKGPGITLRTEVSGTVIGIKEGDAVQGVAPGDSSADLVVEVTQSVTADDGTVSEHQIHEFLKSIECEIVQ